MWRYGIPPTNSKNPNEDSFTQKVVAIIASAVMVFSVIAIIAISLYDCLFLEYKQVLATVSYTKSYRLQHGGGPLCIAIAQTNQGVGTIKTSCTVKFQEGEVVQVKAATTRLSHQVVFSN